MSGEETLVINNSWTWTVLNKPGGAEQANSFIRAGAGPVSDTRPHGPPVRLRAGTVRVGLASDADVVTARRKGRELASLIGFAPPDAILIVAAVEELAAIFSAMRPAGKSC